jgi:hypothetical protein
LPAKIRKNLAFRLDGWPAAWRKLALAALNQSLPSAHILARILRSSSFRACRLRRGGTTVTEPPVVPGYEGIQDGEFFIEPVAPQYLYDGNRPRL